MKINNEKPLLCISFKYSEDPLAGDKCVLVETIPETKKLTFFGETDTEAFATALNYLSESHSIFLEKIK